MARKIKSYKTTHFLSVAEYDAQKIFLENLETNKNLSQ